jgi:hypothetical protein
MNSSELKSMSISYASAGGHIDDGAIQPQAPKRWQGTKYWSAFVVTIALALIMILWATYSPGQDHFASISLNGDGTWYHNYERGFEIQDQEIFFDGIGHSIENAQQADIIFLGPSTVLFGIDWRLLEEFERKHHVKMFNMGFAGIGSGEFSLRLVKKWGLHPKLWIIHADMYQGKITNSFFYMFLGVGGGFRAGAPGRVVHAGWLQAFLTVAGRNIRWRWKMALGLIGHDSYRSAKSGNWYLDDWPNQMLTTNATIETWLDLTCPENSEEAGLAKRYFEQLGGAFILIQVPSVLACSPRIQHLASALGVPAFNVVPEEYSSGDGGGHLDRKSSRMYTARFFAWLEQLPEFQRLFPGDDTPPEMARIRGYPGPGR